MSANNREKMPDGWWKDVEQVRALAKHLESVGWRQTGHGPECFDQGAAMAAELIECAFLPMLAASPASETAGEVKACAVCGFTGDRDLPTKVDALELENVRLSEERDHLLKWIETGLTYGKNKRAGDDREHMEWHAKCGCAYHPDPFPHVHPCSEAHKRPDLHSGGRGAAQGDAGLVERLRVLAEYVVLVDSDRAALRQAASRLAALTGKEEQS